MASELSCHPASPQQAGASGVMGGCRMGCVLPVSWDDHALSHGPPLSTGRGPEGMESRRETELSARNEG